LLLLTYESLARNPSAAMRASTSSSANPGSNMTSTTFPTTRTSSTRGRHARPAYCAPEGGADRAHLHLPREIFGRFVNESFWMDPKNNISQVPVV